MKPCRCCLCIHAAAPWRHLHAAPQHPRPADGQAAPRAPPALRTLLPAPCFPHPRHLRTLHPRRSPHPAAQVPSAPRSPGALAPRTPQPRHSPIPAPRTPRPPGGSGLRGATSAGSVSRVRGPRGEARRGQAGNPAALPGLSGQARPLRAIGPGPPARSPRPAPAAVEFPQPMAPPAAAPARAAVPGRDRAGRGRDRGAGEGRRGRAGPGEDAGPEPSDALAPARAAPRTRPSPRQPRRRPMRSRLGAPRPRIGGQEGAGAGLRLAGRRARPRALQGLPASRPPGMGGAEAPRDPDGRRMLGAEPASPPAPAES